MHTNPYFILQVGLALKVLASIRDYYGLIKNDITTEGVVIKKVILESCCGEEITIYDNRLDYFHTNQGRLIIEL